MSQHTAWIASWFAPQQLCEEGNLPPAPGLAGRYLKQYFRPSLGGSAFRLRFSNLFGDAPLVIDSVSAEIPSADGSALRLERVSFGGKDRLCLEAGREAVSDPVPAPIAGLSRLAVNARFAECPAAVTAHPGSRTTSWIGADVPVDHWYFLSALEVQAESPRGLVIGMGDSITDGRGTTTNHDRRWTDFLARRIAADASLRGTAVANAGIGGNRLLADGLGPSGLSRVDRDALSLHGARWLLLLEGVNDIGTWDEAAEGYDAFLARLLDGYREISRKAREAGVVAVACTIAPFAGSQYGSAAKLKAREAVNDWLRRSGEFVASLDFAAAVADPADPAVLQGRFDSGDHLHLNDDGYRALAEAVDLGLFEDS